MELAEIAGYVIGFLVGMIMGFIGGGGALLLPTLVYLLHIESTVATAYTLVLVGITALFGVLPRLRTRQVDIRTAIVLGIPILLGTLLVRGYLTHLIPDFEVDAAQQETNIPLILFQFAGFDVTKRMLILLIFATALLFSFASMVGLIGRNFKPRPNFRVDNPRAYYGILISAGLFIGILSAFIGAGGGVMIVPLLVIVMGIPMKTVVGTSLAIMAGKSTIGFLGDVYKISEKIDWGFLSTFALVMILGILGGTYLVRYVSGQKLKFIFAWFILAMALFIFAKELLFTGIE